MGEAVTRLPPIVARFRICRDPNHHSISRQAGNSGPTASSTSVSRAAAPICHAAGSARSSVNSRTASSEIKVPNRLNRFVISRPSSVAPATIRASGKRARRAKSSANVVGRRNDSPPAMYSEAVGGAVSTSVPASAVPLLALVPSASRAAAQIAR